MSAEPDLLISRGFVHGRGRSGRIWRGICYHGCYHAGLSGGMDSGGWTGRAARGQRNGGGQPRASFAPRPGSPLGWGAERSLVRIQSPPSDEKAGKAHRSVDRRIEASRRVTLGAATGFQWGSVFRSGGSRGTSLRRRRAEVRVAVGSASDPLDSLPRTPRVHCRLQRGASLSPARARVDPTTPRAVRQASGAQDFLGRGLWRFTPRRVRGRPSSADESLSQDVPSRAHRSWRATL